MHDRFVYYTMLHQLAAASTEHAASNLEAGCRQALESNAFLLPASSSLGDMASMSDCSFTLSYATCTWLPGALTNVLEQPQLHYTAA